MLKQSTKEFAVCFLPTTRLHCAFIVFSSSAAPWPSIQSATHTCAPFAFHSNVARGVIAAVSSSSTTEYKNGSEDNEGWDNLRNPQSHDIMWAWLHGWMDMLMVGTGWGKKSFQRDSSAVPSSFSPPSITLNEHVSSQLKWTRPRSMQLDAVGGRGIIIMSTREWLFFFLIFCFIVSFSSLGNYRLNPLPLFIYLQYWSLLSCCCVCSFNWKLAIGSCR